MANHETEIYELGQIQLYFPKKIEDLSDSDRSEALRLFSIGAGYYNQFFRKDAGHKVTASSFQKEVSPGEIQQIIDYLSKPELEEPQVKKTKTPAKEDSTVPSEIIAGLIKELAAEKLVAEKNATNTTTSVADAVKRAQKTWKARNRTETILKNRTEKQKEAEDNFFINTVDPKSESRQAIYRNVESVASQAVMAQAAIIQAANLGIGLFPAQIKQATDDLTYLGLTGAVDLTNFNDLNTISQLAFIIQGVKFTSPINNVNEVVQAWQKAEEIEPFSGKVEELEKQITLVDQEAEEALREKDEIYKETLRKKGESDRFNEFEREINKNIDLDNDMTAAIIEVRNVQNALLKALPNAKLPPPPSTPLQLHGKKLESILRKEDPTKLSLSISPEGLGSRTVAVLETTNSGNRNISPEAVRLLSLGLTPEKLEALRNDPNSQLNKFITNNQYGLSVYQQVHAQLNKLVGPNSDSKLGQDISANVKALSFDIISQTTRVIPEPVRKLGQTITTKVITKPFGRISQSITNFYNHQSPLVQSATKFILNPKGTLYAWVNKKIGQHAGNVILKYAGSTTSKKLGNFILKEGLQQGAKKFIDVVAKKLIVETAKQAGVQGAKMAGMVAAESAIAAVAAALGISTFGLSLIVGAILMVATAVVDATIGLAKKGLDKVWQEMGWGEKFRSRDLIIPVVAGGAVVATAGATFIAGLIAIRRSVQIAAVSAIGIIIGAGIVVGLYIAIAFLIAPILSTLVQFDSLSKVDYAEYGGGSGPGVSGPGPGGEEGVYDLDCGPEAGAEIMIQAGSYPVVKRLLTGLGRTGYCIIPTKIVIHWSGAWTDNNNTYTYLDQVGLSCQIGTDQNGSVEQWQQMWEKKAELAYCVGGNENNYCLNNEMVGAWFIPPGTSPTKPEEKSPNEDEIQSSVNSTCFMMQQYHIPYTQIFGHLELHIGKPDPGEEFLAYFINRVKQQCPSTYP